MEIGIRVHGFGLTAGLRERVLRRLRFAFAANGHRLRRVAVWLADANGPRGGEDKRCRIQVIVPGMRPVVVEDTEADLYVAIDRAVARAGRTVARRLGRQFDDRRPADVPLDVAVN
jgi:ribosome-associated translation inhibitor RaiA